MTKFSVEDHGGDLNNELVSAIADLLSVEAAHVRARPDSTFVQLGGDSVRALQLTFQLDALDLSLDLECILDKTNSVRKLSDLLATSTLPDNTSTTATENNGPTITSESIEQDTPFTGQEIAGRTAQEAILQVGCSKEDIEYILPVTGQQKLLWLASLRQPDAYIAHWCFKLPESVDTQRLKQAWQSVLEGSPALRLRLFLDSDNTLYQAVVAPSLCGDSWHDQQADSAAVVDPDYGKPLIGCGFEQTSAGQNFHLYAHHSVYDRWSMRLIFDDVRQIYNQTIDKIARPSIVPFLTPLGQEEKKGLIEAWREFVGESFLTSAPDLAPVENLTGASAKLEMSIPLSSSSATKAELITAAWSWVCSKQSNATEISFGLTVWGRDVPLQGVMEMAFPTFHTLPVCMRLQPDTSVADFLSQTKQTLSTLRNIQRLSFEDISSISEVCRKACHYNSIVVVQSEQITSLQSQHDVLRPEDLTAFDLKQGHPLVLECTPDKDRLSICLNYNPAYVASEIAKPLLSHFCMAIEALTNAEIKFCNEINLFGDEDDHNIRRWTRSCEERSSSKMYSMIEEHSKKSPDSSAIWTTRSTMTYGQLMDGAKTFAQLLRMKGTSGHVGCCFEKSTIAIIAQIGISMSGCAYIPMDPANPSERLAQIVQDSHMTLLVCSQSTASKFEGFSVPVLVLDDTCLSQPHLHGSFNEPAESTETAYIVYTSGSTGTPKGVVIQHEQISTSLKAQKKFFNINTATRTLQFSSLAFDMSVHEIYMTLSAGGTVCIPTEAERFELDDFLARARTNYSMLTPSVAATLSDKSLAQISEISLCGEALPKGLVERVLGAGSQPWIVYGPTETTVVDLGHKAYPSTSRFNLGYSFAATAWIVDAGDPHKLAPVGIPGELAFSGHTLAAGYYQDAEKTDAAFRKDLKWTQRFPEHHIERVYLTGDLASYNPDGTIQFLGRLGGYTKIAGNRVDLDEIQHVLVHKCKLSDVSVLICKVNGHDAQRDMLLCFFANPSSKAQDTDDCELVGDYTPEARSEATSAFRTLQQSLPRYMVPSAFIPVNKIPINTSGKLAAGNLRKLIESMDIESLLAKYSINETEDDDTSTPGKGDANEEHQDMLKEAWSSVLSVAASSLSSNSHFMSMGGDSLRAMQLAAVLRRSGLSLLVADIFKAPVLREMAGRIKKQTSSKEVKQMFSQAEYEDLVRVAAEKLQISTAAIENLSLCSSLQVQMLVASERVHGSFFHSDLLQLQSDIDHDEVRDVCRALVEQNELLRTMMFVDPESGRFLQVHTTPNVAFKLEQSTNTLAQHCKGNSSSKLGLGTSLCRFVLLDSGKEDAVLVWEMHHSIYDGHSHELLLDQLSTLIKQRRHDKMNHREVGADAPIVPYSRFIQYLMASDRDIDCRFWSDYLKGTQRLHLDILKATSNHSLTNSRKRTSIQLPRKKTAFTLANYLRATFALVLSRYGASSDVNFAATVNGRDLPIEGIERIAGPTFATLPVRVKIDPNESLHSLFSRIQQDTVDCASHQAFPLEDISHISPECKDACQFQAHLLVQPQDQHPSYDSLASFGYKTLDNPSPMQLQIPFNLVMTIKGDGVDCEAIYDDAAIQSLEVELFLDQMKAALLQMTASDENTAIGTILCMGVKNAELIMTAQPNPEAALLPASTIPDLIFRAMNDAPESEALYSSDVSFTYRELYELSFAFCNRIRETLHAERQMIAFCFEKSPWAIVAQLGILIAGHAFVPIDPAWPETRSSNILQQTKSPLIVTSSTLAHRFASQDINVLTLIETTSSGSLKLDPPVLQPCDVAYVLFTSGTTGNPKGVVVEHGSISRTLQAYAKLLDFTTSTRALLFASFTFDASVMETWSVLGAGGTLCIANDDERISDLSNFIVNSKSDCVGLTPTAAGLLEPRHLVELKTLLLCGEKCRESDLERWRDHNTVLINAYGPTEASVNAATNVHFRESDIDDIGTSLGGGLWIVDPDNVDQLLPVNCTGELVISGPVLAREYLNTPEMTSKRFVKPNWPEWTKIDNNRAFRTGDLARLDSKGRLHICGRNDDQMKINGIRVECGEIESAIHHSDAKIKDVVASTFSRDGDVIELAVYFVPDGMPTDSSTDRILPLENGHPEMIASMHSTAENVLPKAFVPTAYIPVSRIPQSTSGKADRKRLADATSLLHPAQLKLYRATTSDDYHATPVAHTPTMNGTASFKGSLSDAERTLQSMWATVLGLESTSSQLTPDSHFIKVGGDSVAAIRLAAIAMSKGINLPVNVIYANPRLGDMAMAVEKRPQACERAESTESVEAFEMLDDMEILSPLSEGTPGQSPLAHRAKGAGYFGVL